MTILFSKLANHQNSHQAKCKVCCQPGVIADGCLIFLGGFSGYVWVNNTPVITLKGYFWFKYDFGQKYYAP